MKKYQVKNRYGISGETTHRTVVAALRSRDKREGEGWYVCDDDGAIYDGQLSGGYRDIEIIG
jgi:hypothetical protein